MLKYGHWLFKLQATEYNIHMDMASCNTVKVKLVSYPSVINRVAGNTLYPWLEIETDGHVWSVRSAVCHFVGCLSMAYLG